MRRATRNGVIAVAAASGAMAVTMPMSAAFAADGGAAAGGAAVGSPGLISGNTVQLPVHAPVNACGNTGNVVGLLNPAVGNRCTNEGAGSGRSQKSGRERSQENGFQENGSHRNGRNRAEGPGNDRSGQAGGSRTGASGGGVAEGGAGQSPGVLSGNGIELPVHLPLNVSGNAVSVVGIGNAAVGNESTNTAGGRPDGPDRPVRPRTRPAEPPRAVPVPQPAPHTPHAASLAHTGTDRTVSAAAMGGAALFLTGAVLYRRFRPEPVR
ncbi:chaplin family protein [Streptomyces sp. NPDC087903]|uniref:chaplin n=1 Tax=Streptomyces sp. NPDC087903 TaxID=3365819 RepID=UPI0038049181